MRGQLGGMLTGGLVSVLALSAASIVSETPAGRTPPAPPLVDAPEVDPAPVATAEAETGADATGPSTPVGSLSIEVPQTPDLPDGEAPASEPASPVVSADPVQPRADTDPLDEPDVVAIEGALEAPQAPDAGSVSAQADDPVFPNPQAQAPETPVSETDLTVSTQPAAPVLVEEPQVADVAPDSTGDAPVETVAEDDAVFVIDLGADAQTETASVEQTPDTAEATPEASQDAALAEEETAEAETPTEPAAEAEDVAAAPEATEPQANAETETFVAEAASEAEEGEAIAMAEPAVPQPGLQLQGGENTLLADRDTGVVIRRPGGDDSDATGTPTMNALVDFAAGGIDGDGKPLMSVVLIDDGSMSAASAALSGLPFPVSIAINASLDGAAELMQGYRDQGFEVMAIADLPEGAQPADVEITFESVFRTLPEAIGVLDLGDGGLQSDREVTAQAMDILAAQGRGYITASQGLNMAARAAEQAGVPAGVVYRDLDADDQDARVVRRFVDQAAFRARQDSGVVLVGRVRPDTISALILWGTANNDDQVAFVPVSRVLTAQ